MTTTLKGVAHAHATGKYFLSTIGLTFNLYVAVEKTLKASPLNSRRSVRPADNRYGMTTTLKGVAHAHATGKYFLSTIGLTFNLYVAVEKTLKASPLNSRRSVRPADNRYGMATTLKGSPVLTLRAKISFQPYVFRCKVNGKRSLNPCSNGMRIEHLSA